MRPTALALFASFIAPALALSAAPASAAPQILGLIASKEAVPMTCAAGRCTAELSSVCLQQHRSTPSTGTAYLPSKETEITLTVTGSDGARRSRRVEGLLKFSSIRQFSAVKVTLSEAEVRLLGDGAASLSVAPMASIIPVAVPDDPKPLSESEIAAYTGPLRATAEGVFEHDSARVDATRVLNQVINRMPEDSDDGIETVATLLQQNLGDTVSAGTTRHLDEAVEYCGESVRVGVISTWRKCLSYRHDYLTGESTNNVWDAMKPGS